MTIVRFERRAKAPAAPSNVEPGLGDVLRDYAAKGHRRAEMPMQREDTIGDLIDIMEEVAAAGWRLSEMGEGTMNGRQIIAAVFVPTEAEASEGQARSHAGSGVASLTDRRAGISPRPAGHVISEDPA